MLKIEKLGKKEIYKQMTIFDFEQVLIQSKGKSIHS